MSAAFARMLMTLAARCLGDRHREWARAMEAEFEEAAEDGHAFAFAIGCLASAWREAPRHEEGRFAVVGHAFALGLLVPIAALLASAALLGFPYVEFGRAGIDGVLSGGGAQLFLLNEGNSAVGPALTLLVLALAATHLLLAWWLLERDWERVAAVERFGAATATTFALFSCAAALDASRILLPVGGLVAELAAVAALARWHARLADGRTPDDDRAWG